MPGALVTAWAALWLYAPLPARARTWIWRGLALAILPWLHTKFVILLAAMVAALFLRVWRHPKAAAALVTPVVISLGLWFYSFYRLYGVFDPQVPYGDFPKLYVLFANIPRGVLGLLFDQKFWLLNADYARAEPPDTGIGQLVAGLQKGTLGYSLAFRYRQPAPWPWLPGAPRDLVGDRKERPITSVLRHINPWYEVFRRGR